MSLTPIPARLDVHLVALGSHHTVELLTAQIFRHSPTVNVKSIRNGRSVGFQAAYTKGCADPPGIEDWALVPPYMLTASLYREPGSWRS